MLVLYGKIKTQKASASSIHRTAICSVRQKVEASPLRLAHCAVLGRSYYEGTETRMMIA